MRQALLVGVGMVFVGLVGGWVLRRHAPRLAHVLHFGASALARILGAVALAWSTANALEDNDALHIGAAVAFCILALWLALSSALMLYVLVSGSTEPPPSWNKSG
jgi:hypothetical protein